MTDVQNIEEYIRNQRLKWFGLVERMDQEKAPVKATTLILNKKKFGTQKLSCEIL